MYEGSSSDPSSSATTSDEEYCPVQRKHAFPGITKCARHRADSKEWVLESTSTATPASITGIPLAIAM